MARDYRDEYPSTSLDVCEENVDDFWRFIAERHAIWERRASGVTRPWTSDPILASTHYTNVYRELDRGTMWFQAIVAPNIDEREKLLSAAITYRQVGRPETFEACSSGPVACLLSVSLLERTLRELREAGRPRSTNAYVCCRGDDAAVATKRWLVEGGAQGTLVAMDGKSPKQHWEWLKAVPGLGAFLAYEVLTDLLQCRILRDSNGEELDEDVWANVGPGSAEGLRLLYPSTPKARGLLRMREMRDDAEAHLRRLGLKLTPPEGTVARKLGRGPLTLRGVEHCLCEYSKYWLQKRGLGRARRAHVPDGHGGRTECDLRTAILLGG